MSSQRRKGYPYLNANQSRIFWQSALRRVIRALGCRSWLVHGMSCQAWRFFCV